MSKNIKERKEEEEEEKEEEEKEEEEKEEEEKEEEEKEEEEKEEDKEEEEKGDPEEDNEEKEEEEGNEVQEEEEKENEEDEKENEEEEHQEEEEEESSIEVPYYEEEEKEEEEEEKEEEDNEDYSGFPTNTPALRRLLRDYKTMRRANAEEIGFRASLKGKDLFRWEIQVFGFEKGSPMYNDLQRYKQMTGRDYVEMSVTFPPTYPLAPPFIRVVQPRFAFHTGHVTVGGSICTDVLTMKGWSPVYEIKTLMINVLSEIMNGDPRIDFEVMHPYTLAEAKEAFTRIAQRYSWKINDWLPKE